MKIVTDRLEFCEFSLFDVSKIEKIAREMAWKNTVDLLLDGDFTKVDNSPEKLELLKYQECVKQKTLELEKKGITTDQLYENISQDMIPQNLWHINFSMLKPNFRESALKFVTSARNKQKENPRTGFWFSIKDRETGKIIGATILSTKVLKKNGLLLVGHSGQFISPKFQKKGYISETKAVMVDFMYKYLIDKEKQNIPDKALFFTTCDVLNTASMGLQIKSGAKCINFDNPENGKLKFCATRNEIMQSTLLTNYNISWRAEFDNGSNFSSSTKTKGSISFSCKNLSR